jgi:hypothetical protein
VVLRAGGEREREVEAPGRLDRGGHALDRAVEAVELAARVVVLDRAAHRARPRGLRDRGRGVLGRWPVAVLQVDGYGQAGRLVQRAGVRDHLGQRDVAVESPEGEGEAGAGGGERLEAECLEDPG